MNDLGFPDYEIQNLANGTALSFNSGTPDVNGCFWTLDGDLGGWESPDGRVTMLPRIGTGPSADGEIPADLHYKGRTISMKLSGECPSEAIREAAIDLLGEVLDMITTPGLFLANEVVPVQCSVLRSGNQGQGKAGVTLCGYKLKESQSQQADGVTIEGLQPGTVVFPLEATIELYASDPRKYAQAEVVIDGHTGSASVAGGGNTTTQMATMSITTVPGGLGPILIEIAAAGYPTQTMRLVVPTVPIGAPPLSGFPNPVVIDFYNKTITDGAGNNFYYLRDLTTPWPTFPPKPFTITTVAPQGFTAALAPAFL